jgi:hypothetical protein
VALTVKLHTTFELSGQATSVAGGNSKEEAQIILDPSLTI